MIFAPVLMMVQFLISDQLKDFSLSLRTIGDQLGEAKASGNLGNTLKVLGRYDEAAACCQRHLDISRMLHDKVIVWCVCVFFWGGF